ncbi:MAG: hypothetical protein OEO23_06015 [Gemmatimonadota bacterium]|nr:hypothetical protein [Gemmatimonadota bacterium]
MRTVDEQVCAAPAHEAFRVAADVERWPEILPHYRWVRFRRPLEGATGVVEMAAWRQFPGFRYPTWWVSDMRVDEDLRRVVYRHVDGITKGMDVVWQVEDLSDGRSHLSIIHEWSGPRWPFIGGLAADWVIGPHFISHIAGRTLAGVAAAAEQRSGDAS